MNECKYCKKIVDISKFHFLIDGVPAHEMCYVEHGHTGF